MLLALPLAVSRSGLLFQHDISEITSSGSGLWVLPHRPGPLLLGRTASPFQIWDQAPGDVVGLPRHDLQPSELTLGDVLPGPENLVMIHPSGGRQALPSCPRRSFGAHWHL